MADNTTCSSPVKLASLGVLRGFDRTFMAVGGGIEVALGSRHERISNLAGLALAHRLVRFLRR